MGFCASVAGRKYNRQIANPSCGSGWTNIAEHFILTSTLVFQSAAVVGGRNTNSTPAAKPCPLCAIAASPSLHGQTQELSTTDH